MNYGMMIPRIHERYTAHTIVCKNLRTQRSFDSQVLPQQPICSLVTLTTNSDPDIFGAADPYTSRQNYSRPVLIDNERFND